MRDAGVVDENVEPPEFLPHCLEEIGNALLVAHIAGMGQHLDSLSAEICCNSVKAVLISPAANEVASFVGQSAGNGQADSLGVAPVISAIFRFRGKKGF